MPGLIVVQIVPEGPMDALNFRGFLANLQVQLFDLSFSTVGGNSPGTLAGSASYIADPGGWALVANQGYQIPATSPLSYPGYTGTGTSGIVQQVDYIPGFPFGNYQLESVAIAVMVVNSSAASGNFRVDIQAGGQTLTTIPYQYNRALDAVGTPDPATFPTQLANGNYVSSWAALPVDFYVSVPATATNTLLQLPNDGTPPAFDALLTAVRQALGNDPGTLAPISTTAQATAPATSLALSTATGITAGMTVTGSGAIPPGTTVTAIAGSTVTLSQEITGTIPAGTAISFAPNLAELSLAQCQNIAYEIIWGQQPPLPSPPDPIENLYTNPPNTGSMMLSSSAPNSDESDRQQFEGKLQSYYAVADTTADRLTNFVYALSAAIACEQQSIAATEAMLQFPATAGLPGTASSSQTAVILTGVPNAQAQGNFGAPAAYFYALTAALPVQITPAQRYQRATGDQLSRLLTDLTTAINAGAISDAESFFTSGLAGVTINAAQAARRIDALGVPAGSATPLAPLGTVAWPTTADASSGTSLTFADTTGVSNGMLATGPGIAPGTTVQSFAATSVTLSAPILNDIPLGNVITFTPGYTAGLRTLVQGWLSYPQTPTGTPSSEAYQATDDAQNFWPNTAAANQDAFLNLVLAALTQGYVIPAPFNAALGAQISTILLNPPSMATLASMTAEQWRAFFQQNPTWLPPFTKPGNTGARIAAFIRAVQKLFAVGTSGPPSAIVLVTTAATAAGMSLSFASTSGIAQGMSVAGPGIRPGTTVTGVTSTSVDLSQPVAAAGVGNQANITFTPGFATPMAGTSGPPRLQAPSTDWLANCLTAYGAFTFGTGFDLTKLRAAAATVFTDDPAAQAWLVDALVAIDALYQVADPAGLAAPVAFSVVEALYARGFRAAADITELDGAHFQEALTGTVAYDFADTIYTTAAAIAPAQPGSPTGGVKPVNPDGTLTDCIPAPCASPLGAVAYLHEMLTVSELSTCDTVVAAPISLPTAAAAATGDSSLTFASAASVAAGMSATAAGIPPETTVMEATATSVTLSHPLTAALPADTAVQFTAPTLGEALSQRRGPVGDLLASCANLETPLPLIDIVNECLEYLATAAPPGTGTVYDTAGDELAGLELCTEDPCPGEDKAARCYNPARLFAALPQYSTPATPVPANANVEPAVYNTLKADFSSCLLPYSQALDVSQTYLRHLGSCRFEEMRAFRKCITEFVLDPVNEPAGFQSWLWRYPVRIDIAIEYLGITPEEYTMLFQGAAAPPCGAQEQADDAPGPPVADQLPAALRGTVGLPAFLSETCLSYCEFYELWQSGFVPFRNGADERDGVFPRCEPCCLDDLWLLFPGEQQEQDLTKLLVFIRLWRKLRDSCCFCYSFAQLSDICDVLNLYSGGAINPDFVRQFAAFQMLRDHFRMDLTDPDDAIAPGATGADRTQLLALWVGDSAAKWPWAVQQLINRVEQRARRRHDRGRRSPEFIKLLAGNLDPLSQLAGFDPASATSSWHALPTHTLRFAEVLAKIYASSFSVGELIFLFTAGPHLDGDDPFPLQEHNEALDAPLELPDDDHEHGLWRLRRELLAARAPEDEAENWSWRRIEAALHGEFGFAAGDIQAFGEHFFPGILARSGYQVSAAAASFVTGLPAADTSAPMWNIPPDGPLRYDPAAQQLSARVPLSDRAVITKLTHVRELSPAERQAVQDLFFQPRAMLARFALLFADFAAAQRAMIEEPGEADRFAYFRHQFLLCRHRCRIIARHLSHHVHAATGQRAPEGDAAAALILRAMAADENEASTGWESDSGAVPALAWAAPAGSALAALLGLTGTGLRTEYRPAGGGLAWRDISGPLSGFGAERDRENCPVPTVVPSFDAALTAEQLQFASVHNGFLMDDATDTWLGGAQGFNVTWSGALLVDHEGTYEFWAGAPAPGEERPDFEAAEHRRWRVELRRGQRAWVILSHHWAGEEEHRSTALPLKRGAYELTVELVQPSPEFGPGEPARAQHTGFQVKYSGPDSDGRRTEIPHSRLFLVDKDSTLADGITGLSDGAAAYLSGAYVSSLRDIRRTYQRAFKALLFTHRFALSAHHQPHGTSELGYLLSQPALFAGVAYYRAGGAFTRHAADFNFDFLPLRDDYHAPAQDARTGPSPQRAQAMFDWWERMFDYTAARAEVHRRCGRTLWHLFEEAQEKQPAHPGYLLRHMGADERHWALDLRYFQGQNVAVYQVSSADLADDRWTLRAWHADRWLREMRCGFAVKDIRPARPDLWACDDPSALLPGESETGNANLLAMLCAGCLENGEPRRYAELKRLNDGLRERGRDALVAYLCQKDRVGLPWRPGQFATGARDLSDLLLLDVEAGIRERASRIEEAITAAQSYVRRARLGLEPGWTVTPAFARLWDRQFATLHVWQACRRRQLYKENWVEWDALERARGIEAFRFLQDRLRDAELTAAAPGGLEWWPDQRPPEHNGLELLQRAEASGLRQLAAPREGLSLLGTPEPGARPSWLAPLPPPAEPGGGDALAAGAAAPGGAELPYWLQTAIRLGTRFWRVAAAGVPPAADAFAPYPHRAAGDCVTCCEECGCAHSPALDEYYFWLIDGAFYEPPETPAPSGFAAPPPGDYQNGYQVDFYDPGQQEAALWQDPEQLPRLLLWQGSPMVRLAWCRIHDGVFEQPRRSTFAVAITPGQDADLTFLGRTGDSLTFSVTNAVAPTGYGDPSAPGFRYDIASDAAVVLPQVDSPPPAPTFLGALPAYPYFVYSAPGTHLFPLTPFAPALAVACALRSRCRFEAALRWYRLAFDPLRQDCTWIECGNGEAPGNGGEDGGRAGDRRLIGNGGDGGGRRGACCDSTDVSCTRARDRAVLLQYLETLVEWGDALRRRGNSPEAFSQAQVIFGAAQDILGRRPRAVRLSPPASPPAVASFTPEFAPLNPRLLDIYDVVQDRLDLIHAAVNARRLREGRPGTQRPYFGDGTLREGWSTADDPCADECDWCYLPSPYRFTFLIQKAQDYTARAEQLGSALLAAFEKGDAEFLSALRAGQELELTTLALEAKKDQWRDADWQVEALHAGKSVSQANLIYTNGLINAGPGGLVDGEIQYQNLTNTALSLRGTANVIEGVGEALRLIPDLVLGAAGFGGSPVSISWIPLGTKIGDALEAVARIINNSAEIDSMTAGLDQTNASWLRRLDEWNHQVQVLAIEIHQAELQILGAQRRRDQALADLNTQRRQIEQSREVDGFLRDKFTAHELYLFLQRQTLALYRTTYDLALHAARQAQRAFNLERGHTARRFIPDCAWDDLREGLLAGERLSAALRHMEKAYLDENVREYELAKQISLRLHFPLEFLRLRTTGRCEIEIPEWMLDLDAPGMYMRRIKSVSLTIPCVTGPYTGVHCRLTLLGSTTRIDPALRPPAHECCCPPAPCSGDCAEHGREAGEYDLCPDDPRAVRQYDARQAIATSTGQNDSGLFQLSFDDPRYLPFEYMGAVSRWRIELPPENNYFPLHTVTDVVITLNHTAREGGEPLRRAANASAQRHLPGDGWHFFDLRHEFPDAWQLFRRSGDDNHRQRPLRLRLTRQMFPFIPGGREIQIDKMAIVFGPADGPPCGCPDISDCPCPQPCEPAEREVGFVSGHPDGHEEHREGPREDHEQDTPEDRRETRVRCFAGAERKGLYCGIFDARLGPLGEDGRGAEFELRFPAAAGSPERMFLLCQYRTQSPHGHQR
jgi:receptor-binding and translocation channel-forming TcA subunit of Tc toxin/ABC toxin-like protein